MAAYYNENDKKTAAWLRELIKQGHIAPGDVDERSIKDVQPDDLKGYDQVHLFAGCGGWPLATRLAGIRDDERIWTGSCPCQAFSLAGRRKGFSDDRHLWPEMRRLVAECRPAICIGEQVQGAIQHGWLDLVCDELEAQGYACGAIVLPACCVGARQIRQRLWWVADIDSAGLPNCEGGCQVREVARHGAAVIGSGATRWRDIWATEPRVGRVVHGVRPGNPLVRGYGNAVVVPLAAEFIAAYLEAKEDLANP